MNDNLPEINFKEKKEKKGGALGWLRGRLGLTSRGAIGEAGINPSVMNVGRAIGTGGFGSSPTGIAGLLAGVKLSTVLTVAVMAAAVGTTLFMRGQDTAAPSSAFSSDKKTSAEYVPAILRSQAANQGSSLDMFKDTNKGAGLAMEADASKPNKPPEANAAAKNEEVPAQDPNQPQAGAAGGAMGDMMGKLQGGDMASLTSSLGGGSSKFSNMGGFSNKFGSGATGAKTGFSSGIGSGFSGMPKFDQRKNKMMAMKGSARPVFGGSKASKRGTFGSGAFSQAKGLKATQRTYSGTNIDSARSTQDKAWTGATGEGDASGGAGLSDGGAGVVTSPSMDNASGATGGGADGNVADATVPEASAPTDVSPWKSLITMIMMLVLISCVISAIAAKLKSPDWLTTAIRVALAAVALVLAVIAIAMSVMLMSTQKAMGSLYMIGGVLAAASAVAAMMAAEKGTDSTAATTAMWLAAGGGVIALIGSMLGGK